MKPNYRKTQLTEQYVEIIKNDPTLEADEKYGKLHFDQVESESHVMGWRALDYLGFKYLRETAGFIGFTFMYLFGSLYKDGWDNLIPAFDIYYIVSLIASLLLGFTFWGAFAELVYDYRFGDKKIVLRRYKNEPEFSYKLARGLGWFGSIFCVVMALVFSPMIFVGAGAFALVAFRMINMRREYFYQIIPYDSILFIRVNKKIGILKVYFKEQTFYVDKNKLRIIEDITISSFNINDQSIEDIIIFINKKVGYDVDTFYSMSKNINKDIEDGRTVFQKIRSQNPPLEVVEFDLRELRKNSAS